MSFFICCWIWDVGLIPPPPPPPPPPHQAAAGAPQLQPPQDPPLLLGAKIHFLQHYPCSRGWSWLVSGVSDCFAYVRRVRSVRDMEHGSNCPKVCPVCPEVCPEVSEGVSESVRGHGVRCVRDTCPFVRICPAGAQPPRARARADARSTARSRIARVCPTLA